MTSNNAEVSSAALIELQTDLTRLSESLHELYDLMNTDMTNVAEFWRDPKYQVFVSGYRPQINKCEEISERYSEWCKRVLDPTIERVIAIETTDVGGDGGGGVGIGNGGGSSDSGSSVAGGNNRGFNLGSKDKAQRFRDAAAGVRERIDKMTPGPQGSGFSTPQNERPYTPTPQQINDILNGKRR